MRTLQTPPQVERVVERDEYAAQVRLDPRDLLPALIHAMGTQPRIRALAAQYRSPSVTDEIQREIVRELAADPSINEALTVHVDPGDAEDVGYALIDAADQPDLCLAADCEAYAIDRTGHCAAHHRDAYE